MKLLHYVAAISGGKDSLAMFELILEKKLPLDAVIFFDTGMEFKCIYRNLNQVKRKCLKRGIKFIRLTPSESFEYQMLEKPIHGRKNGFHYGKGWCGGPCRWGTTQKTQAMGKLAKRSWTSEYLGIAYDEKDRLSKPRRGTKLFPLADYQMTEADCLKYARKKGYSWREGEYCLYDLLDRVSCWCCKNKNLKELRNYYWFLPDYWRRLKELEEKIGRPMKNGYSLNQLEERFKEEPRPKVYKRYPQS